MTKNDSLNEFKLFFQWNYVYCSEVDEDNNWAEFFMSIKFGCPCMREIKGRIFFERLLDSGSNLRFTEYWTNWLMVGEDQQILLIIHDKLANWINWSNCADLKSSPVLIVGFEILLTKGVTIIIRYNRYQNSYYKFITRNSIFPLIYNPPPPPPLGALATSVNVAYIARILSVRLTRSWLHFLDWSSCSRYIEQTVHTSLFCPT